MPIDQRTRERLLAHCGELHEDDGVDPRQFFKTDNRRNRNDHKTRQLCKQIAETLTLVLAGEFGDERLHNLQVVSVSPAPDAQHLSITLASDGPCSEPERRELLSLLAEVNGRLRFAIAAAITRKRTPKLHFQLAGPNESTEVRT